MSAAAPLDATDEIRPLVEGWFRAAQDNDDDWFSTNALSEFVYQMGDGTIADLHAVVPLSHRITDKAYEVLELTGRRYGATVVAFGLYSARGNLPLDAVPAEMAAKYARGVTVRFSQVWVDGDDGRPRIALLQSTTVGG